MSNHFYFAIFLILLTFFGFIKTKLNIFSNIKNPNFYLIISSAFIFILGFNYGFLILACFILLSIIRFIYCKNKINLSQTLIIGILTTQTVKQFIINNSFQFTNIGVVGIGFCLIKFFDLVVKSDIKDNKIFAKFLIDDLKVYYFPFNILSGPVQTFPKKLYKNNLDSYHIFFRLSLGFIQLALGFVNQISYSLKDLYIGSVYPTYSNIFFIFSLIFSALSIYLTFSGYTNISIACANANGFYLPENFDAPFLKSNVRDFWKSWHMSLTNWITGYVYMPCFIWSRRLFKNGSKRFSVLIVFIVMGFWHGLSFQWFLWGLHHSIGWIMYDILINNNFFNKFLKFSKSNYLAFHSLKVVGIFITLGWFVFGQFYIIYL